MLPRTGLNATTSQRAMQVAPDAAQLLSTYLQGLQLIAEGSDALLGVQQAALSSRKLPAAARNSWL